MKYLWNSRRFHFQSLVLSQAFVSFIKWEEYLLFVSSDEMMDYIKAYLLYSWFFFNTSSCVLLDFIYKREDKSLLLCVIRFKIDKYLFLFVYACFFYFISHYYCFEIIHSIFFMIYDHYYSLSLFTLFCDGCRWYMWV